MNDRTVDVVVIARGGGAATDLAVFDDEALARAIATSRHPIITGIGHQTDQSIADLVAGQSFKTPTDAAHGLIARVTHFVERLAAAESRTVTSTRHQLERTHGIVGPLSGRVARSAGRTLGFAGNRVTTAGSILSRVATMQTSTASSRLDQAAAALDRRSATRLTRSREQLASLVQQLSVVHPQRSLARGWSITRAADGTALRSVSGLSAGDGVTVELTDGTLAASITEITERIDP
jgi:exodeoxyribonuclease VII large subunit